MLNLPTDDSLYPVSIDLTVRMVDTFGGEHLGNHAIVSFANEAMMKLYDAMGFGYQSLYGVSFIQREMHICYLSEARYTHEIRVFAAIEAFEEMQYSKIFRLYNRSTQREVAHLRGLFSSFDYKARKKVAVPEALKTAYQALLDKS